MNSIIHKVEDIKAIMCNCFGIMYQTQHKENVQNNSLSEIET